MGNQNRLIFIHMRLKDVLNESVNEGRELKSIQSDLNKTIVAIQSEISSYKATKGTPQEKKHVDNLKKLHPIKKKLESELESAVSGLYRDAELKIED
jgi:glycyl-tRNA synthetase beta subunit